MIDLLRGWFTPKIPLGAFGPRLFRQTVSLPVNDLTSHIHVIGTTGSGKSRFLAGLILNLLERGQALTVIDPHGDLVRLVMAQLVARGRFQDERLFERLIFLDIPAAERQGRYLPFNVLRQSLPVHSLAANVKEAFHRAWPALSDGAAPMFDTLIQDGAKVLASNDLPLTRLYRLLSDRVFRELLLERERDPEIVHFFRDQFERLPPRDQLIQAGSALRRAHLLTFSPVLRHSLGQAENLLNFRQLIDDGRSVLINLALPDADSRRLLGCLLTVFAEQGALSRSDLPADQRTPIHHLFIDEWSEFAAQSEVALARILSLTRKVGLFAVLAHQTWSQADQRMQGALQNVGLQVTFRLGRNDAELAARHFGAVDSRSIKHRVADPTAAERGHPLYEPLPEQWEGWIQTLQGLPDRHAFLRQGDGRLKHFQSLAVPDPKGIERELADVERIYLQRYFRPINRLEKETQLNAPRDISRSRLARRRRVQERDTVSVAG